MNQDQNAENELLEIESQLQSDIREAVSEYAAEMQLKKMKSLARHNPEKVAKILYLFSTGSSQTALVRKYGMHRDTVVHVLTEFADQITSFRELGGKLAARNYISLSSLEEDLILKVRERMEQDPDMQVSFKDLKEISIAKANAAREALTARGEVSSITEDRKVYTQDDYEATIRAARERIAKAKQAQVEEVIDVDRIHEAPDPGSSIGRRDRAAGRD